MRLSSGHRGKELTVVTVFEEREREKERTAQAAKTAATTHRTAAEPLSTQKVGLWFDRLGVIQTYSYKVECMIFTLRNPMDLDEGYSSSGDSAAAPTSKPLTSKRAPSTPSTRPPTPTTHHPTQ